MAEGVFGMGSGVLDMWGGGPMIMGPRGGGARGMGMVGVPRGVGIPPPMHRLPLVNPSVFQSGGSNNLGLKPRRGGGY